MNIQKEVESSFKTYGKRAHGSYSREKYQRDTGMTDYRNGSYCRTFCVKVIGDNRGAGARDRDGAFISGFLPGPKVR